MRKTFYRIRLVIRSVFSGQFGLIVSEVRRRIHSNSVAFGLRRDLAAPFTPPDAKIEINVRPCRNEDASYIFRIDTDATRAEINEIMKRKYFFEKGVPTCYAAVTTDDVPCYIQWLLSPRENETIKEHFQGTFPLLAENEGLLEFAFTLPDFRGQRIMPHAMARIAEQATQFGARYVITFVSHDNIPALKGCKRAGFSPYMKKVERWRFFRKQMVFDHLPEDTPYSFDER